MLNLKDNEKLCIAIVQEVRMRLNANGCEAAELALLSVFRSSVARQRQVPSIVISLVTVLKDAAELAGIPKPASFHGIAIFEAALACDRIDRDSVRAITFSLVDSYIKAGEDEKAVDVVECLEWPEFRLELAAYFGKLLHDAGFHTAGEILLSILPEETSANERLSAYTCQLDKGEYATALATACYIPTPNGHLNRLLVNDAGRDALVWLTVARALQRSAGVNWPRQIES